VHETIQKFLCTKPPRNLSSRNQSEDCAHESSQKFKCTNQPEVSVHDTSQKILRTKPQAPRNHYKTSCLEFRTMDIVQKRTDSECLHTLEPFRFYLTLLFRTKMKFVVVFGMNNVCCKARKISNPVTFSQILICLALANAPLTLQ
jgi:hypothetical protein